MDFSTIKMVISVITNVDDPDREGKVQCNIPGYIDDSAVDKSIIPWIKPIFMSSTQHFTKPQVGDKAFVLINDTNEKEYWYMLYHEPHALLKSFLNLKYDQNPEVLVCQDQGNKKILFTYDDKDGFVLRINDNILALRPDGTIDSSSKSGIGVGVVGQKVVLGAGGAGSGDSSGSDSNSQEETYQPSVLGNTLKDRLEALQTAFETLSVAAETDPHTSVLIDGLNECARALENLDEMLSKIVQLN